MQKGFTLLRLLVVVLIIGVLAAVALPQYQRAVGKARAVEAKTLLSSYMKALHVAHLETGKTSPDDVDLSVEIPVSQYWDFEINECISDNGAWGCSVGAAGKNSLQGIVIYLVDEGYLKATNETFPAGFQCTADNNNIKTCAVLGFTKYDEEKDTYWEP